jgi:eukaryotic-like serine/threonine-protein kinase
MTLTPGTTVGPYVIRSPLGAGGMGEVYLARDTKLDRDVALKLLPGHLSTDADRLRRFELEARAASALNHPAIVAVYELGQSGSQPYISMELVDGQTLRQALQAGPMPLRHALQLGALIADGLAKAHDAGIVHRDLKPENLMVTQDGFAKILDFGLAKLSSDAETLAALETRTNEGTTPGSVMGTAGYMAPEQASGGTADTRSDQFSFGLVLYEMLAGRRAFARETAVETLSAIIRDDPPPVEQFNPSVPLPVRWILDRCLAKRPADRYGSTRDLARDLASARDHLSELTGSGRIAASNAVPAARIATRRVVAWVVAAGFAAAALAFWLRPTQGLPDPHRTVRFTITPPVNVRFASSIGISPFALSPDGRHLVFGGIETGKGPRLWLHSLDSVAARPIAGTDGAWGAFWSPDSLSVGFFAHNKLKRVSISGGEPAVICDAPRGGGGGTWNRDGVIVFTPSIDSALFRVSAAGGSPTALTALDTNRGETAHVGPLFLPDGRHFVFAIVGGNDPGMYVASLDSTQRKRLPIDAVTAGFSAPDFLFFMRDRTLMTQRIDLKRFELIGEPIRVAEGVFRLGMSATYATSPGGTVVFWPGDLTITQPTWFARDGTPAGTLGPPAAYMNLSLSVDGRQAAIDRFDGTPGIWLLDATRGTSTRVTSGGIYESTPIWSPDGSQFVFAAARDTPPNLYLKRVDASAEERVFRNPLQSYPQSWSRDGRYIAYVTIDPATNSRDIWIVPPTGDRKPAPFLQSKFDEIEARISPNGRWMAYASNESGRMEIFVTGFPEANGKWPVSTNGGRFPVWRHDSRELFYRAPDGTLMAVSIAAADDFSPSTPVPLFRPRAALAGLGLGTFYDVSPDGRFLINVFVERTSQPATVVLNWRGGVTLQTR